MIFFDIDNTLIDHKKAEKEAIITTFIKFGMKIDRDILELWSEASEKYYDKYLHGFYSFDEQGTRRVEEVFKKIGIYNNNSIKYDIFFNHYLAEYEKNWFLYEDVLPVLKSISKNNRLGIISNGNKKQQLRKLEETKVIHFFENIIISSEIGYSKPNEIIFKKACEAANESINDCLYIGDNFQVDIIGSIDAGLNAIYLNRNNKQNIKKNNYNVKVIQNLYGLIEYFL